MDNTQLNDLLSKLKTELAAHPSLDATLRSSLEALDQDIRRALTAPAGEAQSDGDEAPLSERAQEIEARFAAEHPVLVNTLRDVMDSLGKMGI